MIKISIIGGGNMGEAILSSIRKKYFVMVAEKDPKRQEYLRKTYKIKAEDLKNAVPSSEVVIIAVKPQDIDEVLRDMNSLLGVNKLVISIAAGITTAFIEKKLPEKTRVIRAMPNMPAMIGQGITAVSKGQYSRQSDLDLACRIFEHVGKTVVVSEDLIDAVTAVSGSGPAYVFLFLECLIKAAQKVGLSEDLAKQLVKTTFSGSMNLLEKQKEDAANLRAKVTSKGGTTQAATDVFMNSKIDEIIAQAVSAAKKRASELSRS